MPKAQAIPRPWSRPATQLAEIMAKVALELEARSDQGPSGDLNRNSIQEACRAQRDATAWLGRWRLLTACWRGANLKWPTETRLHGWACEIRTQKRRRKLSLCKVARISGN